MRKYTWFFVYALLSIASFLVFINFKESKEKILYVNSDQVEIIGCLENSKESFVGVTLLNKVSGNTFDYVAESEALKRICTVKSFADKTFVLGFYNRYIVYLDFMGVIYITKDEGIQFYQARLAFYIVIICVGLLFTLLLHLFFWWHRIESGNNHNHNHNHNQRGQSH